jgi:hypothetical protein
MITSKTEGFKLVGDVPLEQWRSAALLHPSIARLAKMRRSTIVWSRDGLGNSTTPIAGEFERSSPSCSDLGCDPSYGAETGTTGGDTPLLPDVQGTSRGRNATCRIAQVYDRAEALDVAAGAIGDYRDRFGDRPAQ